MNVESAFLAIKDRSLFTLIPPGELSNLLKAARLKQYEPGNKLEQPPAGSSLEIVVDGEVSLRAPDAVDATLTISGGRSIELRGFLNNDPWQYAWTAERASTVLSIDRGAWDGAMQSDPTLANYLVKVVSNRELQRLKNDMRIFGFTGAEIRGTISKLQLARAKSFVSGEGAEGDKVGRFIAVVNQGTIGTVAVLDEGDERTVGEFRSGDYFLVDRSRKIQFQASPDAQVWVLLEEEWKAFASSESITRFLGMIDPLAERLAALTAADAKAAAQPQPPPEEEDDKLTVEDFKVTPEELTKLHALKPVAIRQHDQMDCGAACMAMVAKFYGRNISLPTFRSLIHVTRDGASMLSIKKAAEKVGMLSIGVMSGPKGLQTLRVPFIALMQYHFVVVYKVTPKEVVIGDPARGIIIETFEKFSKDWSRNALLFKKTETFDKFPESPLSFRKYSLLFKGFHISLTEVFIAAFISFILGLAAPLFMQFIFDNILVDGKKGILNALGCLVIGINVLSGALEWAKSRVLTHLTTKIDTRFSSLFVRYTMKLPLNFFAVRRVGDITARMSEIERIRDFFTNTSISMIINFGSAMMYMCVLMLYSLKLFALFALLMPFLVGFVIYMVPKLLENQRDTYKAMAKNSSVTFEQFNSFSTLKTLNAGIAARWRWEGTLLTYLNLKRDAERLNALTGGVATFAKQAITLSMLLYAASLYMKQELTLGMVVAVNTLVGSIIGPIITLVAHWNQFNQVGVSLARIDDIFTSAAEADPPVSGTLPDFKGEITFSDVVFQYGSEMSPVVLDRISFKIKAGETVALVGRSGSGKTTLGYMVNLLYAPTKGKILIDGMDTRQMPLSHLRSQIAMIVQENMLFSGTIVENITMGDPHPSFKRAVAAAKAADAHGFISSFPDGYSNKLGEGGDGLSGGQRQRINIARALYREPAILVMDEATSALDAVSEQVIMEKIKARSANRTTIIIAHRLNTIMHADRIVVMEAGKIIETGSHSELLEKQGHYCNLFRKQLNL